MIYWRQFYYGSNLCISNITGVAKFKTWAIAQVKEVSLGDDGASDA